MNTSFGITCRRAVVVGLFASVATLCPSGGQAGDEPAGVFALRNQNPFLQIYGLPTFQTAVLVDKERSAWGLSLDLANHADFGDTDIENFVVDGETYFLTLSMRRRVADWLEVGVDLPLVSHADGFMDNMIEGWHDFFGMSNTKRQGPANELGFLYQLNGEDLYRLESSASGIGDIQLTAAIPLGNASRRQAAISLRSSVKLPSGDTVKLLGSGAVDASIAVHIGSTGILLDRDLGLNGFAGLLVLGDGDVLPNLHRETVGFGGMAAAWHLHERFTAIAQLSAQSSYYKSDVEELGGSSLQLAVGGNYTARGGTSLRLAVVEDVSANATTDFAVHFSVRTRGGEH